MKYLTRVILVLLFVTGTVSAQPYYFRHYEVENGLSNNTVFCSIQDKNGLMWFGTKDGLNRFDGYRFKTYNIDNNDESSLTSDHITSLAIDKNGTLWVGSLKGIHRFDAGQERLVAFNDTLQNIRAIFIDTQNQLWCIAAFTLYRYNFEKKQLTGFLADQYFNATSISEGERGTMWFSTTDGWLQQFNNATQSFTGYNVFAHSVAAASRQIEKILCDKKGSVYIGSSSQGIKQFNIAASDYKDVLTYNDDKTPVFVRDILQANDSELWFATESGIFILNKDTHKFINLRKKYLDTYSLSDNAVYTLYKDSEGGIWAGTYFGGINYFPRLYSFFQKYFPDYTKNSISGSAVREICEDRRGNVWIGTEDAGLNKLNPKTGRVISFEPTGAPASIAYSNIHGLLVVDNDLWIGTFENGLDIMDIKTGKVKKHYIAGPGVNDLKSNFIVSLLQTKSGDIYVGSGNGLYKYDLSKNNFIPYKGIPEGVFISCLMEDHRGTTWAGTHGKGIFYFNAVTGEKGHFENQPGNKNSVTTNTINALYEDSFHNLWLATEGGGLCQLSKNRQQFQRFTTKQGLPSNFVFKVLEDNKKTLWITTSKGLVNMDIWQGIKTVYTQANGLLNDQFNYNSGYKDAAGQLYFGSVRGMITFNPDEFYQSKFQPPIYITGFQVLNKELDINKDSGILRKSILYTDKLTLPYYQSSFSIDFAAISFTSPEMTEYSYIMEGLDKDWTHLPSNRKAYFTNVQPGAYTFKVKAGNNGVWNKQVRAITIHITPPFWATRWAYLVYSAVFVSLLYWLARTYHDRQENKKEKEIYEAKIEFFTNIAHEIKTPLTLIKGPVENLGEMVNDLPVIKEDVVTMERNTSRLVNLINQILDFRQTETKGFSLDFALVSINEVLREAYLTFEPVAKKRKLMYEMELPADNIYTLADGEALNKIFSNLFSNAVKYAEKKATIKLITPKKEDKFLAVEISNDGFIIPEDMKEKIFEPFFRLKETVKQKGTGIGLALARSLTELHKGSLYLKKPEEGMNVFVIILPYRSKLEKRKKITKTFFQKTKEK